MKRALWTLTFFFIGLLASWKSALLGNEIARKFAWPQVRLPGCWDIEHCHVPLWGYGVILTTIFGPAIVWGYVGFRQARQWNVRGLALAITLLSALTILFYVICYGLL